MLNKLIETFARVVGGLMALMLLPCLLGAIMRSVGAFHLLLVFGILSVVAYLRQQNRAPSAARKRGGGAERTPLVPKGDD